MIEARRGGGDAWVPGIVSAVIEGSTAGGAAANKYNLAYNDGSKEHAVPRRLIHLRAGGDNDAAAVSEFEHAAVYARGELSVGDVVDARRSGGVVWERGTVSSVLSARYFGVRYDKDGEEEAPVRCNAHARSLPTNCVLAG